MTETVLETVPQVTSTIDLDKEKLRLALLKNFGSLENALAKAISASKAVSPAVKVVLSAAADQDELKRIVNAPIPVAYAGLPPSLMTEGADTPVSPLLRVLHHSPAVYRENLSGDAAEAIRLLVDAGADVNAVLQGNGSRPLAKAMFCNHLPTVALLLEKGADPSALSPDGKAHEDFYRTGFDALDMVVKARNTGHMVTIKNAVFKQMGYGANSGPFHKLSKSTLVVGASGPDAVTLNSEVLRYAVSSERSGLTGAFHLALSSHADEVEPMVTTLLEILRPEERVAVLNPPCSKGERSLLHTLAGRADPLEAYYWVLNMLLEAGVKAEAVADDPRSPLHIYANYSNKAPQIHLLARHGADVNAVDHIGDTPLVAAAKGGQAGNMKALLECGADLSACDKLDISKLPLPTAFYLLDLRGGGSKTSVPEVGLAALFDQNQKALGALRAPSSIAPSYLKRSSPSSTSVCD